MEISVDQMYRIEGRGHEMGFLKKFMMENAGAASARRLVQKLGSLESKNVLVLAGMGNNGGDGLVIARHLAGYGARVTVVLLGEPGGIKTEESRWNWQILQKMPSVKLVAGASMGDPGPAPDVIIDAMLGTGISGDIAEPYASAINYVNGAGCFKLAVDVPSGLDPETGRTAGVFVRSDMTVTFHRMKRGMPGRRDLTGELHVEKIGIPPEAEEGIL